MNETSLPGSLTKTQQEVGAAFTLLKSTVLFSRLPPLPPLMRFSLFLLLSRFPGAEWGDASRPAETERLSQCTHETGKNRSWLKRILCSVFWLNPESHPLGHKTTCCHLRWAAFSFLSQGKFSLVLNYFDLNRKHLSVCSPALPNTLTTGRIHKLADLKLICRVFIHDNLLCCSFTRFFLIIIPVCQTVDLKEVFTAESCWFKTHDCWTLQPEETHDTDTCYCF